jgi:hypothetical protein
MYEGWL